MTRTRTPESGAPARQRGRRRAAPDADTRRRSSTTRLARYGLFALLGAMVLVTAIRVVHLGFPLERDEGEFGYIAQEVLRGVPVYESAHTQKLPGTYLVYALFITLFGHGAAAIHLGLLLANLACMALVFLILRRTHGDLAGLTGAVVLGVMAASPTVLGFAAHATFFVVLCALAGLHLLLIARERGSAWIYFASGACFGLAVLMKQPALFYAPLALVVLVADEWILRPRVIGRCARRVLALGAGTIAPLAITAGYYLVTGKFSLFWYWAFEFAGTFTQQVGWREAIEIFRQQTPAAMAGFELLWVLGGLGLVAVLWDRERREHRWVYATFVLASLLAVVPGFHFTNHYYITALPAVALMIGALVGWASEARSRGGRLRTAAVATVVMVVIGLAVGVASHGAYYFGQVADTVTSHRIYGANPFPESIPIAKYIAEHTRPDDRVAILGSETQILFYARRRSATRFVNTYYLTAIHDRNRAMQQEMIREIEEAQPAYMVFVSAPTSWSFQPDSPRDIMDWFNGYIPGRYEIDGMCEVLGSRSIFKWGEEARTYRRTSDSYVAILRRVD